MSAGDEECVTVRRTEWSDVEGINNLIGPATADVFGRINVIRLLEKVNLAVTLSTVNNEVLAHASFSDQPVSEFVEQGSWETLLQPFTLREKLTPWNVLFLRLFVAQPSFSIGGMKEIVRTVFNAEVMLEHICLLTLSRGSLEPALQQIFHPISSRAEESQYSAYVCHRHEHCPPLHIREASEEDLAVIRQLSDEECSSVVETSGRSSLSDLIQDPIPGQRTVVCESEGTVVGFVQANTEVDLHLLYDCFDLGAFKELTKPSPEDSSEDSAPPEAEQELNEELETAETEQTNEPVASECVAEEPEPVEPPNVFCIQLFAIEKRFEMRSAEFLPYLFTLFTERLFCVVCVRRTAAEVPLLQSFTRIPPRHGSTFPHEFFIYRRGALLRNVKVRVAMSSDVAAVESLTEIFSHEESVHDHLERFLQDRKDADGTILHAFVAQFEEQVVGLVILRDEEDTEYIRARFDVERFLYFSHHQREEHGTLCHFIVDPVFLPNAKHILKEVLRLAHKSSLYYHICSPYDQRSICGTLMSVLNVMVPVTPRRQIIYPLDELSVNAPSRQITTQQAPFALYHTNRKLIMEPKVSINDKIVVVGASDTGLAFLETLAFCSHLRFNNLTLVSSHGLVDVCSDQHARFLSTSHSVSDPDSVLLALRSRIHVVKGTLKAIHRKSRTLELMAQEKVDYDHLVLCTGLQYQMLPRWKDTHLPNIFSLGDQQDCADVHRWLVRNFLPHTGMAVLYGSSLDVYTCVETLLSLGVSGSRIHIVHPDDPSTSCFSNAAVRRAVKQALDNEDVHVHLNCQLSELITEEDPDHVTSVTFVTFTTGGLTLRLKCDVFFNFSHRSVNYDAFHAISQACLVFDARLVINRTFRTNDPLVYAAGPLTKYSRRYHMEQWSTSGLNSREAGQSLAAVLLPLFDPTLDPPTSSASDPELLVPMPGQAKIQGGRLPGGYHYLDVRKPTAIGAEPPHTGGDVETGSCESGNYFHMHINQKEMVDSITCFSTEPLPVDNILCLYGKHQILLNHLVSRFSDGSIPDFYSYFRESWCLALYHDRFPDFQQEVQQIMDSAKLTGPGGLEEALQKIQVNEEGADTDALSREFQKSQAYGALRKSVLDYLKYNSYHLTMYAKPGQV